MIATYITYLKNVLKYLVLNYSQNFVFGLNQNQNVYYNICKIQSLLDELSLLNENTDDDLEYFQEIKFYLDTCLSSLNLSKLLGIDYSGATLGVAPVVLNLKMRTIFTITSALTGDAQYSGFILPSRIKFNFIDITLVGYNRLTIGDEELDKEAYFSDDLGVTSKSLHNLAIGDKLYLNTNIIGYDLDITDKLEIIIL
jgi:hypothetical protein